MARMATGVWDNCKVWCGDHGFLCQWPFKQSVGASSRSCPYINGDTDTTALTCATECLPLSLSYPSLVRWKWYTDHTYIPRLPILSAAALYSGNDWQPPWVQDVHCEGLYYAACTSNFIAVNQSKVSAILLFCVCLCVCVCMGGGGGGGCAHIFLITPSKQLFPATSQG